MVIYILCYNDFMELTRTDQLPFSDYVLFYLVDLFGVGILDFYYYILVGIAIFAVSGWIWGIYVYFNYERHISESVKKAIKEYKK